MSEPLLYAYVVGAIATGCIAAPRDVTLAEAVAAVTAWPLVWVGLVLLGLYQLARRAWKGAA